MNSKPDGVVGRGDVLVPEWAADLRTGDVVAIETSSSGVIEAEVIGFSELDDYYGRPTIETPDCVREQLAEEGRADETPDVLALREEDLVDQEEEELQTDGGVDVVPRLIELSEEADELANALDGTEDVTEQVIASCLRMNSRIYLDMANEFEGGDRP